MGMVLILASHYVLGILYDSDMFKESNFPYWTVYILIVAFALLNGTLALRTRTPNALIKWIVLSSLPGLLFMTYARMQGSSGGMMPTTWDWGLWELFLPALFTVMQLFMLIYFLGSRKGRTAK